MYIQSFHPPPYLHSAVWLVSMMPCAYPCRVCCVLFACIHSSHLQEIPAKEVHNKNITHDSKTASYVRDKTKECFEHNVLNKNNVGTTTIAMYN